MEDKKSYVLTVNFSEPQIVDMKKVFYTPCIIIKSPRQQPSPSRLVSKKSNKLEVILTEQIKRRETFEEVYEVFSKINLSPQKSKV